MADRSSPFISVIVPSYNRSGPLEACLSTLAGQRYDDRRWEVIVVDDGSFDGTEAMLARVSGALPLRCMRHEERRGSGPARNTALECARGDIVLFLDSDTLSPPWLLAEHAHSHGGRRRCYVNGPAIGVRSTPPSGAWPFASRWVRTLAGLDFAGSRLVTANVSCRRDELLAAGRFDAAFGSRYGWEDTELGVRLRARGVAWAKNRRAFVLHLLQSGYDWRERGRKQREAGENAAYFRAKHPTQEVARLTRGRPVLARALRVCGFDAERTGRACADEVSDSPPSWAVRQAYEIQQYERGLQAGRERLRAQRESCQGCA